MKPDTFNIDWYRGDTLRLELNFATPEDVPIPLETAGWLAQIREKAGYQNVLASMEVDTSEAAIGRLTVTLDAAETQKLSVGEWDLQHTDADGFVRTYVQGTVAFEVDVSRAS